MLQRPLSWKIFHVKHKNISIIFNSMHQLLSLSVLDLWASRWTTKWRGGVMNCPSPLPSSFQGRKFPVLGSVLNVCCSMRRLCWSWYYRQLCIMNSVRLASNDGQIYKDKNQYHILKVTIAFVNNSVFISDLCGSWMAWASKRFLRPK